MLSTIEIKDLCINGTFTVSFWWEFSPQIRFDVSVDNSLWFSLKSETVSNPPPASLPRSGFLKHVSWCLLLLSFRKKTRAQKTQCQLFTLRWMVLMWVERTPLQWGPRNVLPHTGHLAVRCSRAIARSSNAEAELILSKDRGWYIILKLLIAVRFTWI